MLSHRTCLRWLGAAWIAWALGPTFPLQAETSVLDLPSPIGEYLLSRWSSDDGLPQNSVISMAQTSDGYIWLSTFSGLARFDGLRFEVFDGDLVPELAGEYFTTLRADHAGNLWLHNPHKGLVVGHNGRFRKLGEADGLPPTGAESLEVDKDGTIWVGDAKGRLLRYDGQRLVVACATPPTPTWGRMGSVMPDPKGRLWALSDNTIAVFDQGRWTVAIHSEWSCPILTLHDGSLLRVSGPNCDRLLRHAEGKVTELGRIPGGFSGHFVREDAAGNIWFTCGSGVLRLDPAGQWTRLRPEDGLMVDTVRSELTDREGNYWFGTDGGGLVRLKRRAVRSAGLAEGMTKRIALSVAGDGADGLWVAALTGGLNHFDGRRFSALPAPLARETGDLVWCVYPARDGGVWLGSYSDGLLYLDASRRQVTQYTYGPHPGMVAGPVFSLLEDRSGAVWLGGERGGLSRLAGGTFRSWSVTNGLPDSQVNAIAEDREGAIWVGTPQGLCRLAKDFQLTKFTVADGLAHDTIRALFCDREGTLWIGGHGVTRYRDGRFTAIRGANGLPVEVIKSIVEDDLGYLWFSTPHGLLRGERRMLADFCDGRRPGVAFTVFDRTDGLPSNECSGYQSAAWKNPDGRLYFPTLNGLAIIDPAQLPRNDLPPPVIIESVRADDRPRTVAAGSVEIAPGTARVELGYTALSFTAPERNRFRYRLTHLDQDWRDAGTERAAVYTRLSPGRYTFEVLGSNSDGVWSPQPARLALLVLPSWWQTGWFRSGLLLGLFGAAMGAYTFRIRALTRARLLQEEFSRRLIASQENERQRIARELHDSLGQNLLVIKSRLAFAQQQSAQPERLAEQLGEATAMTSQAIREVREISQNLRPFQLDELGLSKALAAMVRKLAATSPIRFVAEVAELQGALSPEFEINFFRIVQECLNNVIKHSGATHCAVTVTRDGRAISLVVADDGRGFSTADLLAPGVPREGFGLAGIQERARTMAAQVEFVARPGGGTRVMVSIPLPT
jgi:signal transduction histidine kinase/ligand-binding sensor domain-containing protein